VTLKTQLSVDLKTELRCNKHCKNQVQLFIKNVLSLDNILDGTMALPSAPFSPFTLVKGARAMMKHSAQPVVTVEAACSDTTADVAGHADVGEAQRNTHSHAHTHRHAHIRQNAHTATHAHRHTHTATHTPPHTHTSIP